MEQLVSLSEVTLNVDLLGPRVGVPLLVIHGGPSWSHHYLLPGLELVAERRRVVAPDLRGCGLSSTGLPIDAYQPELAVADLIELVSWLGVSQVDLLGFSTGGQWAQLLVATRPDLVRRLVLASTTAYADIDDELDADPAYLERLALPPRVAEEGDDRERTVAWAVNGVPTSIHDLTRTDEYLRLLDRTVFTGDWLEPFRRGLLHAHRPADPEGVLRAFGKPVLILHGEHDLTFPASVARRLHAAVPGTDLVVLPGCGHQAQFEAPREWAEAVIRFLAE